MNLTKDNIVDLKTYSNNNLTFKVHNIGLNSKRVDIFYLDKQPLIMFPKSKILNINNDSKNNYKISTTFDVENVYNHHKFLQLWNIALERKVNEYYPNLELSCSHNYFDRLEEGYRNKFVITTFKTTQNTEYFDKNRRKISHYSLSPDDEIICLAYTKGLFMDGEHAHQTWTAHQIIALSNVNPI